MFTSPEGVIGDGVDDFWRCGRGSSLCRRRRVVARGGHGVLTAGKAGGHGGGGGMLGPRCLRLRHGGPAAVSPVGAGAATVSPVKGLVAVAPAPPIGDGAASGKIGRAHV